MGYFARCVKTIDFGSNGVVIPVARLNVDFGFKPEIMPEGRRGVRERIKQLTNNPEAVRRYSRMESFVQKEEGSWQIIPDSPWGLGFHLAAWIYGDEVDREDFMDLDAMDLYVLTGVKLYR